VPTKKILVCLDEDCESILNPVNNVSKYIRKAIKEQHLQEEESKIILEAPESNQVVIKEIN